MQAFYEELLASHRYTERVSTATLLHVSLPKVSGKEMKCWVRDFDVGALELQLFQCVRLRSAIETEKIKCMEATNGAVFARKRPSKNKRGTELISGAIEKVTNLQKPTP